MNPAKSKTTKCPHQREYLVGYMCVDCSERLRELSIAAEVQDLEDQGGSLSTAALESIHDHYLTYLSRIDDALRAKTFDPKDLADLGLGALGIVTKSLTQVRKPKALRETPEVDEPVAPEPPDDEEDSLSGYHSIEEEEESDSDEEEDSEEDDSQKMAASAGD
jgi:TATA-binding protein-associated factor Taf7